MHKEKYKLITVIKLLSITTIVKTLLYMNVTLSTVNEEATNI